MKGEGMVCDNCFTQLKEVKCQRINGKYLYFPTPGTPGLLQGEQTKETERRKCPLITQIGLHGQENCGAIVCRQRSSLDQMLREAAEKPG